MAIRKVLLVGANGSLGTVLLQGLVAAGDFEVSVGKRASSTSVPKQSQISIVNLPDAMDTDGLASALRGHDAVIAAFPLADVEQHLRLAEAASLAGVSRYMPADFGSCDAASPNARRLLKLYRDKDLVRQRCEALAERAQKEGGAFTWTGLVCGHFFDYGIHDGLLHFFPEKRYAEVLDGGDVRASASTLRRVAEATAQVLRRPGETRNRTLYVQSFCVSQNEVLAALERATGEGAWDVAKIDSASYIERAAKKLEQEWSKHTMEEIVFVLGALEADWTKKDNFAMELLGLQDEDLDAVIVETLAGMGKGDKH